MQLLSEIFKITKIGEKLFDTKNCNLKINLNQNF